MRLRRAPRADALPLPIGGAFPGRRRLPVIRRAGGVSTRGERDKFLGQLPKGWPYGVEMRNRNWLRPDYFDCLARHQVTHVYNSWEAMPPVGEQMALTGSQTHPALVAARFLLKPGRRYEDAVKTFQPYDKTKEVNDEARKAGAALIADGVKAKGRKTFIYVNNRLEGNALSTIEAMVEQAT